MSAESRTPSVPDVSEGDAAVLGQELSPSVSTPSETFGTPSVPERSELDEALRIARFMATHGSGWSARETKIVGRTLVRIHEAALMLVKCEEVDEFDLSGPPCRLCMTRLREVLGD